MNTKNNSNSKKRRATQECTPRPIKKITRDKNGNTHCINNSKTTGLNTESEDVEIKNELSTMSEEEMLRRCMYLCILNGLTTYHLPPTTYHLPPTYIPTLFLSLISILTPPPPPPN